MNKLFFLLLFIVLLHPDATAQVSPSGLPNTIFSGDQGSFHVQGAVVDQQNGYVYFSFTNKLIKTDFQGNLLASVSGFLGHLGDLVLHDGKVYGSLEYKNDAIGKGINKTLGIDGRGQNGFYIAIFDVAKMQRVDMDAEKDDLLHTIHLNEVLEDFEATVKMGDRKEKHRFACSGIDGITFGPAFGKANSSKMYLYVAYGVYGTIDRTDNDYQVILQYDVSKWDKLKAKLSQDKLHRSGPKKAVNKFFLKTGSTTYGIQNLAYDAYTGNFFAAVYKGKKTEFPNYDLFVIDGHKKPIKSRVWSDNRSKKVKELALLQAGPKDETTGIRGWFFKWGATGLCPLGDGLFYISHNLKTKEGQQQSTLHKYKWLGTEQQSFVLVEE